MTREEAKQFITDISWDMGSTSMDDWSDRDGEKLREALEALEQTRWIPVRERLPEKDGRYLTYIVNPYDKNLRYIVVCDFYFGVEPEWCPDDPTRSDNVVAWMPLPEPPYGAESEE